jgi:nucleoid DNA-binding protein
MTKKDIVMDVAEKTGIKQIKVRQIVQKTLDAIIDALKKGDRVELRNFGVFSVKHRKGRKGRNPRTGQEVPVPPKAVAVFKPGLQMKIDIEKNDGKQQTLENTEGEGQSGFGKDFSY